MAMAVCHCRSESEPHQAQGDGDGEREWGGSNGICVEMLPCALFAALKYEKYCLMHAIADEKQMYEETTTTITAPTAIPTNRKENGRAALCLNYSTWREIFAIQPHTHTSTFNISEYITLETNDEPHKTTVSPYTASLYMIRAAEKFIIYTETNKFVRRAINIKMAY